MAQKRLNYIPSVALNSANQPNGFAFTEPITGQVIPGGGLNPGDWMEITLEEATSYSAPGLPLFEGRYQWVQVEAGAIAANIARGKVACWHTLAEGNQVVTDFSRALAPSLLIGVFLNALTPGYWGWIQLLGRASLQGTAAVGDVVAPIAGGNSATSATAVFGATGVALTAPVATIFQARLVIPQGQM